MNSKSMNKLRSVTLLAALAVFFSLGLFISGCGPDETPTTPKTTPTDTTSNAATEYIIIDGTRFESGDFTKRVYDQAGDRKLEFQFGALYPQFEIQQKLNDNDELDTRVYIPSSSAVISSSLDIYEVGIYYAEGDLPTYCQNFAIEEPSTPHSTYELKRIEDKLVSEFGVVQMECREGNNEPASTIEGYLVWEE